MDDIWWRMEDGGWRMDDTSWMMGDSSFGQLGFLRDSLVDFM